MVAAWAVAGLILFACYWRLSWTVAVNSDGAGNALQAWDMLHGNLLLHGWKLSDVSFYTTELPEYMLVELALGLSANVVHVAAAATYTLVVAARGAAGQGQRDRPGRPHPRRDRGRHHARPATGRRSRHPAPVA